MGSFGLVTKAKRLDRALEGFRQSLGPGTDARFYVVGDIQKGYALDPDLVESLGERLVLTGRETIERFYLYMLARGRRRQPAVPFLRRDLGHPDP